jgi:hypothetical protein
MAVRSRREVSIGAPTPRLLVAVTSILFRAVAKTICLMREVRAADGAATANCRPEIDSNHQ